MTPSEHFARMSEWKRPRMFSSEGGNEASTGTPQLCVRYEINVSKDGRHIFATDSHIRNYRPEHIATLVGLLRSVLPGHKISVNAFGFRNPRELEPCIENALKGLS
jgi:hypothetical protein